MGEGKALNESTTNPHSQRGKPAPPFHSEAAQRAVLGSCLLTNEMLRGPAAVLRVDDLVGDAHRKIFKIIRELGADGGPFDVLLVADELTRRDGDERWFAVAGDLVGGAVPDFEIVRRHVENIQRLAGLRRIHALGVQLQHDVEVGGNYAQLLEYVAQFVSDSPRAGSGKIQKFDQIPDIMSMEIPAIEYLIDGLITRGTITLWAGADGVAKTFLIQRLAVEVARGGSFLGRRCRPTRVLYCDYENPAHAVRDRIDAMTEDPIPNLRIWGNWLDSQPPQIGDESLLTIAREAQPLVIVDPFRYAHTADENSSGEMAAVMQHLRLVAAAGGSVIIVHHVSKAEGSGYRGSTAIRGAVDLAIVQEQDGNSGLLTLSTAKNRFGPRFTLTVQPDFDAGTFKVADSREFTRLTTETDRLEQIILEKPGQTTNEICGSAGIQKKRASELLKSQNGFRWTSEPGPHNSLRYYPVGWFPKLRTTAGTTEPHGQNSGAVPKFPPLKGGTVEPPTAPGTGWTEEVI